MPLSRLKTKNNYEFVKELPSSDLSSYLLGVFVIVLDVDDGGRQEPDEELAAGLHLRRGLHGLEGGLAGGAGEGRLVAGVSLLLFADLILLSTKCMLLHLLQSI